MKRLRILLALTALTIGTSAFASAQGFHNQRSSHQDPYQGRDQHFTRDRGNGVEYKYPVYDKDDRGRDRDDRWKVTFRFKDSDDRGRHEYGDRR
jgi:hypothetical protein